MSITDAINRVATLAESKLGADDLIEVPAVIDTYVNGNDGYRIWSDGYCEQWGILDRGSDVTSNASISITLFKSYKDTNYLVIAINGGNSTSNGYGWHVGVDDVGRTLSSFRCYGWKYETSNRYINWKTSGYLAQGQY